MTNQINAEASPLRIRITPWMRVHRLLRKCASFKHPESLAPVPLTQRLAQIPEAETGELYGWFDKRSRFQGDGYYIVIYEKAIVDIEPEKSQFLPYNELVDVHGPQQKFDVSRFVLHFKLSDGSETAIKIPHVDGSGAIVFTIHVYLMHIINDRQENDVAGQSI